MHALLRWLGCLMLMLAGCQVAPRQTAHKAAVRANTLPVKHGLTESPTLERAAPTVESEPEH